MAGSDEKNWFNTTDARKIMDISKAVLENRR